MSKALYIPGADRSSRWFLDDYPDQFVFDHIDKDLLHSTETGKKSGCPGYQGGSMAPTATINPWPGYFKTWQHFPLNRAARALGNPASTPVSENKDFVVQFEIIGYSDPRYGRQYGCYLPELPDEGIDYLVKQLAFVHKEWSIPTTVPSTWPLYKVSSWAAMEAAHMTSGEYDRFRGILAHLFAPKPSSHGDVALKIQTVKKKLDRILLGDAMAGTNPTYRSAEVKALFESDCFPHWEPPADGSNPFVTGANWYKYVGGYVYDARRNTGLILTRLDALEKKLDRLILKLGA